MTTLEATKAQLIEQIKSIKSEAVAAQLRLLLDEFVLMVDDHQLPPPPPPISQEQYLAALRMAEDDIKYNRFYTHDEVIALVNQRFAK